jgi:glycosyltransferase involved in cell wall biosynthesis
VNVIRIPIIPRGNSSVLLFLNYLSFVISGFFWQLLTVKEFESVFIFEVSPMSQALPGIWFSKRKKIPCYIYVQDLWPENVIIASRLKNKFIINIIGLMVNYIYTNCTKIFASSSSFIEKISLRGVSSEKLIFLPQYAEEFYKPLQRKGVVEINSNKFNITYTGNIGSAQGLDILPHAAYKIKQDNKDLQVCFNIIGEGRYKKDLQNIIKKLHVEEYFNFIETKEPYQIPEYLAASDFAFLSLSDNSIYNMTIPAKLQSYMACGIPILAAVNGESSYLIKESKSGFSCPSGDFQSLVKLIFHIINLSEYHINDLGKNGRIYSEKHFNKKMLLDKIDKTLFHK